MSRSRTVTVDVDVDLDEFETDDLVEELKLRGQGIDEFPEIRPQLDELYYAFKFGREEIALQLARKLVCDATGRIL